MFAMGLGPYRPVREFESAIKHRALRIASALAREIARERGRPIDLQHALELLSLIAVQKPESYDTAALRWLARWASETPGATIDKAADIAAALADLAAEPARLDVLKDLSS